MKRIIIYIIVLTLSLLVPEYGTDVGQLIPVELVFLYREGSSVVVEADTGNYGRGETVDAAIRNLKASASGEIFLDTADYLLVDETATDQLNEIGDHLKGSVRVCMAERGIDLASAAQYLSIHQPETKLKVAKKQGIKGKLKEFDDQIILS